MVAFIRRHKRLTAVLMFALLAFELWRIALALPELAPYWQSFANSLAAQHPLGMLATVLAFALQMTLAVMALRWLHRKLFRRMDSLTPPA
jgi:hypothetical protein